MRNLFLKGACPECALSGKKIKLQLNRMDYWECSNCNLQLQIASDEHIGILLERGKGLLKETTYDSEKWGDKILVRKPLYQGDDCIFTNENELKDYLNQIV